MTVRSNQPPVENFPAVMSRLYSQSEDVRIAALPEILQYGQLGKDLLIKIIETEKGALLESAFELFVDVSSKKYEQLTIELNKSNESLNDVTKKIDKEISQLKSHISQLDKEINQLKFQINQLEKEIENLENNKNRLTQKSNELSQYRFHEEAKEKDKIKARMNYIIKKREEIEEEIQKTFSRLNISSQSNIKQFYALQYHPHFLSSITIFIRLKIIVSTQLEIETDKITLNTNFAHDLRADELDGKELILAIEEEFDIEITDEYIYNYTGLSGYPNYTMKDIFEYIISHKKQNIEAI